MTDLSQPRKAITAGDIAEAISVQIGSYVHDEFLEFIAANAGGVKLWYMNAGGEGPTFEVDLRHSPAGWIVALTEYPPGTDYRDRERNSH
jgi:hypothetical protein